MSSAIENIFVLIEPLEFITGIWRNRFIILLICADWVETKNIFLFDVIFTCVAISRISTICIILEDSLWIVFYPEVSENHQIITIIMDFFWNLNTSLGVFYSSSYSTFPTPSSSGWSGEERELFSPFCWDSFSFCFFNLLCIKLDTFWVTDYLKIERNLTWKEYMHKNQYFSHHILINWDSSFPWLCHSSPFSCFNLFFMEPYQADGASCQRIGRPQHKGSCESSKHYHFFLCSLSCTLSGHSLDNMVLLHTRQLIKCDYQWDCSIAVSFNPPYQYDSGEQKTETDFCEFAKSHRVLHQGNAILHSMEERRTVDILLKNNSLRAP